MRNTPRVGIKRLFRMPNIASLFYAPGRQPNSPGESCVPYGDYFRPIQWPNRVASINALQNFGGAPRDYPVQSVNNAYAPLPAEYLYIGGIVAKSKG